MGCVCSREREPEEAPILVLSPSAAPEATPEEEGVAFRAAQYNILASYLGDNRQPWFLYGLPDLTEERRDQILALFYAKNSDGSYANAGWPHYVSGVLSDEEQRLVEEVDARDFAWAVRRDELLKRILSTEADVLSLVELDQYEEFFRAHNHAEQMRSRA